MNPPGPIDSTEATNCPAPAPLLRRHLPALMLAASLGPVIDVACGSGRNGIFLASQGVDVVCCDRSAEVLERTSHLAVQSGANVRLWQVDLEQEGNNPFPENTYGAILVFRYLHRPLMPCLGKALREGGVLMYETYTVAQAKFGRPRRPDHLLKPGELLACFEGWEILHWFEGILEEPTRAVAQLVCRKR